MYLSLFSSSYNLILWSSRTAKSTIRQVFCFLLTITRSGLLAEIRWSVCISKSRRIVCVSITGMDSGLYIYHSFAWSNLNFLHSSWWITFPNQLCWVFFFFLCQFTAFTYYVFDIYHHITYICYFVPSYLFLLWYSWCLWRCFVLLSEVIYFLSKGLSFLLISKFSRVRFLLFCLLLEMSICCIAVIQLYTYTCGNIVNTIMTNEHASLEKYTSHLYSKGLRKGYVWEVS